MPALEQVTVMHLANGYDHGYDKKESFNQTVISFYSESVGINFYFDWKALAQVTSMGTQSSDILHWSMSRRDSVTLHTKIRFILFTSAVLHFAQVSRINLNSFISIDKVID